MEGGSAGCMETRPRWRGSGPKTRQTVAERGKFGLKVSMMGTCEGYTCYSQHNAPNKIMWSACGVRMVYGLPVITPCNYSAVITE